MLTPLHKRFRFVTRNANVNVQRINQVINGRQYKIEVSSVGLDKWRAQIARLPGGSAATMPFYGKTPDEAAGQLSRWLEIANGRSRTDGTRADLKVGTTDPGGH